MADHQARPPALLVSWHVGSFGQALRELREGRGTALRGTAPMLRVSAAQLSRLERDLVLPDETVVTAAEEVFAPELRERDAVGLLRALAGSRWTAPRARVATRPTPALLVGRDRERTRLTELLMHGGVVLVEGGAGVGKSALVDTVAHSLSSRFHNGITSARVNGSDGPALDDVLAQWLIGLGVEQDRIPDGVAERGAALRRCRERGRLLLVLDGARSVDDVRPLIPLATGGSSLVAMIRCQLPDLVLRGGARHLTLRPLSADDGALLIRHLVPERVLGGIDPRELLELSRLCGGSPLALTTAAARFRRSGGAVDQVLDALRDETRRLDALTAPDAVGRDVRSTLVESYAALEPHLRWLFRLLGLHRGPAVTLSAVAALAGQRPDTVGAGLDALARAHLLEPTRSRDRWIWPDLARLVAGELVRSAETSEQRIHAVRRWVQWLVDVADEVTGVSAAEHDRKADGNHDVLDAEATSLPAVALAAAEHGQQGLVTQLISLLDQAGRSDLAEICEGPLMARK